MQEVKAPVETVHTYRALRYLDIGEETRNPGELVPEAATWFRVEHLVNCKHLEEVQVPVPQFARAVKKYCPNLMKQLASSPTKETV